MAWSEVGEMEGIQRQASIVGPVCGQCELNGAQLVGFQLNIILIVENVTCLLTEIKFYHNLSLVSIERPSFLSIVSACVLIKL